MQRDGVDYIGILEASQRMRKAPPTIRLMLERGEAQGTTVRTVSGRHRQYVSVAWLESWEAAQDRAA